MFSIPFNKPYMTGKELKYVSQAHEKGHLAGDGDFTRLCHEWLESRTGTHKALLTHSCTAALEMTAILADIQPGDEVILPSYTFVSTANAFVMRGAVLVFVDIRSDTLNLDESKIEAAITNKTKVIVPVHYAGVACEMDTIMAIAQEYNLLVIEDAAQGVLSKYKNRPLGSIGHLGTLSFHETKNIISGEGGALLVNNSSMSERAVIIREKGTDRCRFLRGEIEKYTWVDEGSSYLPSELVAAFLWAQMEEADKITERRHEIWNTYHNSFESLEDAGYLRRPVIPPECSHNAHMYYIVLPDSKSRNRFISQSSEKGINCIFHYVPLHSSPMGMKFGVNSMEADLSVTDEISQCLVRLPLWLGLEKDQSRVTSMVVEEIGKLSFSHL